MNSIMRIAILGVVIVTGTNLFGEPLDKSTQRYLDVLMRKPSNSYLFDRFYNEWLKHSGVEELEVFLKAPADKGDATYVTLLAMYYEKEGRDAESLKYLSQAIEKSKLPAELLIMRADINLFNNDPQAALKDLETAMKDKNLSAEKRLDVQKIVGRAYVAAGDTDKAAAAWQKALAGTSDGALREEIMELMISEGMTDQALELCGKLIDSTTDNYRKVMLQLRQGEIYDRMGLNAKTLEAYDRALAGVETESWLEKDILGRIERIYTNESNTEGLLAYYNKLLDTRKKDLLIMRRRAEATYQIEGPDKGIAAYRKILDVTPGNMEMREQFARFLVSCGETTQAITVFEELAAKSPRDGQLWLDLAKLYRTAKRDGDVAAAMKKYLACSDGSESAYLRTAKLLEYCKMDAQASAVLREMLKKYPDSVLGREALADSLHMTKNDKQAIAALNELAAAADADAVIRVAEKFTEWKMPKDALAVLVANEKRFPKNSAYYSSLGRAALAVGKYDIAVGYFRRQLELAEGFDEIAQVTGELVASAKSAKKENQLLESLKEKYTKTPDKFTPSDGRVLCELYTDAGDTVSAGTLLAEMLKKNSNSAMLWTQAYQAATRNDDYTSALAALKRLLALESRKSGEIYRLMVDISLRNNQRQQALQYTRDWKRAASGSSEPWLAEARVQFETQDITKAIDTLRDAARKFPDDNNIQEMLVNYYTQAGKYADARRCLWKLFEQANDMAVKLSIVTRLTENAMQAGSTDSLVRNFETRAKTDPRSVFPHLAMSKIYERTGDYQRRRDALYRAFELSSDNVGLLHEIARLETQEGDYSRAIETLKKAVALDKTPLSRNTLIDTYLAAGEDEKGYAMLMEQMGEKVNDSKQGLSMLDKLVQADQIEQAVTLGEQFIKQFPDDAGLKYYYGQILRLADKPQKAADIFIALLDYKDKTPAANNQMQAPMLQNARRAVSASRVDYQKLMQKAMPAGYMELQQVVYLDGRINIQRGGASYYGGRMYISNGPYYGGQPGAAGGSVYVPQTAMEMVQQSWNNLRGIYNVMDDAEQKALLKKFAEKGRKFAKPFLVLNSNQNRNMKQMDELCAEFPDFDGLQFLKYTWRSQMGGLKSVDFAEIDKIFGKKYPLSTMFLLFGAGNQRTSSEIQAIIISRLKNISAQIKANPELSMFGLNFSYAIVNMCLNGNLDDKQKKELFDFYTLCRNTYKTVDPNYNMSMDYAGVMMVMAMGNYEEGVKQFNEMIKNTKTAPVAVNMRYYGHSQFGRAIAKNTVMITQINFDAFPPYFMPTKIQSYMYQPLQQIAKAKDFNKEKFLQAIAMLKDTTARLAILSYVSKDDASQVADAISKNEKASLQDLQMVAYWFAFARQNDKAAQLLQTVFEKTKKDDEKQYALASMVILTATRNPDKKFREYVIKNLDQLKPNVQEQWERERVVQLYRQLGQEKLAARYLPKQPVTARGSHRSHGTYVRPAQVNPNDINILMQKQDFVKAAALLVKNFRQNCPKGQVGRNNNTWILQEVINQVRQHKLEDEFMKQLEPKADTTVQRIREYAMALEMLGKNKEAAELYEKLLLRKPRDEQANLFLAGYYICSDPSKALGFLKKFSVSGDSNAVSQKIYEAFSNNPDMSYRIGMMRVVHEYLKLEKPRNDMWFISNMLSNANNVKYNNNNYSGILYDKNSVDNFIKSEIPEKLRKEYIIALSQLCDLQADISGNPEPFFTKQRILHFYGGDQTQLVGMAKKMMLNINSNPIYNIMSNRERRRRNRENFQPENPCEYIVKRAVASGNWSDYDDVVTQMSKSPYPQMVKLSEQYRRLKDVYTADEKSYSQKIDAMVDAIDVKDGMEIQILNLLAASWSKDGRNLKLTPVILKLAVKCNEQPQYGILHNMHNLIQNWVIQLATENKSDEIFTLLEGLEKILISADEIKSLNEIAVKDPNFSLQNNSSFQQNQSLQFYGNLVTQLPYSVSDEDIRATVMSSMLTFVGSRPYLMDSNFKGRLQDFAGQIANSYESIAAAGLLKDIDSYCNSDKSRIYGMIIDCIAKNYANNYSNSTAIIQKIRQLNPQTFGSMLLVCAMDSSGDMQKMLLEKYAMKIQAMPKERKAALVKFLLAANVLNSMPAGLLPEVQAAYTDIRNIAKKELQTDIQAHLSQIALTDIYRYQNQTIGLLNKCLDIAPEQFDVVFSKSVENMTNSNNYSINKPIDERRTECMRNMASRLLSSSQERVESWKKLFDMTAKNIKNPILVSYIMQDLLNRANSVFNNYYNKLSGQNGAQEKRLVALKQLIAYVDTQFGPMGPVIAIIGLGDILRNYGNGLPIGEWLAVKATETKQPRWLEYKVLLENNWEERNRQTAAIIAKMLSDETIRPYCRISLAGHCLQNMDFKYSVLCYMPLAKLVVAQNDPTLISWQVACVAGCDELQKDPALPKKLNELFRKRYETDKNSFSNDMRYGAFVKIACEAGDFKFAKEMLADKTFNLQYGYNQRVYLGDLATIYVLLAKYKPMHETLLAMLKIRNGNLYDQNSYFAQLIQANDIKAFFDMFDKKEDVDKFVTSQMVIASMLQNSIYDKNARQLIADKMATMRSRYAATDKLTIPELIDVVYYFRGENNEELNERFVETVPFEMVFNKPEYKNRTHCYNNIINNYFNKYLAQKEDSEKLMKVVNKVASMSYIQDDNLRENMGQRICDLCCQYGNSGGSWKYAPQLYASLMEKLLPKTSRNKYVSGRMACELLYIYYLTGDEKHTKNMIETLKRMDCRDTNDNPAWSLPGIFINIRNYEGKRNEKIIIDRVLALPDLYDFANFYGRVRFSSVRYDVISAFMKNDATKDVGMKLTEKYIPNFKEQLYKKQDMQAFLHLYAYYDALDDKKQMQVFLDEAISKVSNSWIYSHAIRYFEKIGEYDKAMSYGELGLKKLDEPQDIYFDIRGIYICRGEYEKAGDYVVQNYKHIKLHPAQCQWLHEASTDYTKTLCYEKAIDVCKQIIDLQKQYNVQLFPEQKLWGEIAEYQKCLDDKKKSQGDGKTGTIKSASQPTSRPTSRPVVVPVIKKAG